LVRVSSCSDIDIRMKVFYYVTLRNDTLRVSDAPELHRSSG
jgi:hypothetical protein